MNAAPTERLSPADAASTPAPGTWPLTAVRSSDPMRFYFYRRVRVAHSGPMRLRGSASRGVAACVELFRSWAETADGVPMPGYREAPLPLTHVVRLTDVAAAGVGATGTGRGGVAPVLASE